MMATEVKRIKCAHCKEYHGSIDEVRACSKTEQALKTFQEPVPPAQPAYVTLRQNALRDAVPAGRYAIEDEGIVKFYKVSRPTEGRWAGRVFVERQLGDDHIPIKTWRASNEVLNKIVIDPAKAMLRYGREIGSCGHCGRTLTNEISRAAGIGPICRSRMGW